MTGAAEEINAPAVSRRSFALPAKVNKGKKTREKKNEQPRERENRKECEGKKREEKASGLFSTKRADAHKEEGRFPDVKCEPIWLIISFLPD